MIDRNITKTELMNRIKVTGATIAKLSKNEYVALSVLDRICNELDCKIEDILEIIK
jgi:DNA-binding Xre family transcriptional regulator